MTPMRVLLLTAPMVQLNTPYPATAYLAGFLRLHADALGLEVAQADPALELFLRLYCREGLARAGASTCRRRRRRLKPAATGGDATGESPSVASFLDNAERYLATVDAVVDFLQGRDPKLAARIVRRKFLPEGPRFASLARALGEADPGGAPLALAYRELSLADRAKHLASLYVDDLADAIREGIDPRFELSRYAEKLATSAASFDPLQAALDGPPTLVDELTDAIGAELAARHRPDVVGISAPFPGNVYGAFRLARAIKRARPAARLVLGGGYVNTELRDLAEPRVFDSFDYVTLDDGERPLLSLLRHLGAGRRVVDAHADAALPDLRARERPRRPQDRHGGARRAARRDAGRRPTRGCRSTATSRCSRC